MWGHNNVDPDQMPQNVSQCPFYRTLSLYELKLLLSIIIYQLFLYFVNIMYFCITLNNDDDDEFRFNNASTHEGHLRQNGELTWFCSETIITLNNDSILI